MRLLDTRTGRLVSASRDHRQTRYAILSHVWNKGPDMEPELTYEDLRNHEDSTTGSILDLLTEKVRKFCEVACNDGYDLGWVDTCCIDKSSSSELSEAINSMYEWYSYAGVCYVFLHDVASADSLVSSTWFSRGWTLQELLAPTIVLFLSSEWGIIGSKQSLSTEISETTKIDEAVLTFSKSVETVSVARRMSWAAHRMTTREEDRAYSLMGIFGVNMPTTYGEGSYAFIRLQEEILKRTPDQTIFCWGSMIPSSVPTFSFAEQPDWTPATNLVPIPPTAKQALLAPSPQEFEQSVGLDVLPRTDFAEATGLMADDLYQVFTITPYGISALLPLIAVFREGSTSPDASASAPTYLALLACKDNGKMPALLLRPSGLQSKQEFFVGTVVGKIQDINSGGQQTILDHYYRATYIPLTSASKALRKLNIRMTQVFIPHGPPDMRNREQGLISPLKSLLATQGAFKVRLSSWSYKSLRTLHYDIVHPSFDSGQDISLPDDRPLDPRVAKAPGSGVVLSRNEGKEQISIQVGRCYCVQRNGPLAILVTSNPATSGLKISFDATPHHSNNPAHIHSWNFRGGFAYTSVTLRHPTTEKVAHTTTLRLTISLEDDSSLSTSTFVLGLDVSESTIEDGTREGGNPESSQMRDPGRYAVQDITRFRRGQPKVNKTQAFTAVIPAPPPPPSAGIPTTIRGPSSEPLLPNADELESLHTVVSLPAQNMESVQDSQPQSPDSQMVQQVPDSQPPHKPSTAHNSLLAQEKYVQPHLPVQPPSVPNLQPDPRAVSREPPSSTPQPDVASGMQSPSQDLIPNGSAIPPSSFPIPPNVAPNTSPSYTYPQGFGSSLPTMETLFMGNLLRLFSQALEGPPTAQTQLSTSGHDRTSYMQPQNSQMQNPQSWQNFSAPPAQNGQMNSLIQQPMQTQFPDMMQNRPSYPHSASRPLTQISNAPPQPTAATNPATTYPYLQHRSGSHVLAPSPAYVVPSLGPSPNLPQESFAQTAAPYQVASETQYAAGPYPGAMTQDGSAFVQKQSGADDAQQGGLLGSMRRFTSRIFSGRSRSASPSIPTQGTVLPTSGNNGNGVPRQASSA